MKRSKNKISAKIIVGLISSFLIIIAVQGQSIWTITNPIPPWDEYTDVQFIDDQTGWAVGYEGRIIKSTNGGSTWFELNSTGINSLSCLYFFDLNDGWVAGNGIYKTMDGGSTWEYNFGINENNFRSIQFISDQTGYTGNYNGKVFKTTDGGMSWDLNYEFGSPIVKIFFLGEFTGWALSWHDILTTTDGGENWAEISLPAWNTKFNDVQFIDENRGWIVSDNGLLMGSVDGGLAWDTIQTPATTYDDLVAVHFFNEVNGRVFSKNKCYITTDGGISWEVANAPYMYNQAACFPSENVGYSVGERMYYTNDAGYNWEQSDIGHTFYQS
ncbi:MAG: hypothetical protein K8S16_05240, partial [Bacteroidales bacterium]|nr:hypothetical protein [Bacteroidales bacterium]